MDPETPSIDDWLQKVAQELKGRSYPSLFWQTLDGFAVPPLLTHADVADVAHRRALPLLRTRRGFAIRELCGTPRPRDANARVRRALDRGADEVELCLDSLAQDATAPSPPPDGGDEELGGWSAPGDGGVAIHTRSDLDEALDGIDLARVHLSFSAGEGALPVLAWWLRRADALGVPRRALRGGIDVDPIARLTMRRVALRADDAIESRRAAIAPVFGEAVAALRTCAAHCPAVRPLVVDGQGFHLAGAPPAIEVGATIASLIEVARRLAERGVGFDALASGATLRVQVGHELLSEIAKLRALRLLWAKVATAFGASGRALLPRVLGVTSGRFRASELDQRTNLIRTALAGFAAVVGGCDSVIALTCAERDDLHSTDLARDQLHLLRAESHLDRVADPTGGSFAIERLTDEIARRGWEFVHDVEKAGGFLAAARGGFLGERIAIAEEARERAFRTRRRVLVGISRFADLELGGPLPAADEDADPAEALLERHADWLARRDASAAQATITAIEAVTPERFFDHALGDGVDHATLEELATATWPPDGVAFEHRFLPIAVADGHEFEELRLATEDVLAAGDSAPTVMLVPFGAAKPARARADFARDLFLVAGFTIVDPGLFTDAVAAVDAIRARRPAVAVLCAEDGAYAAAVDALRAALADDAPRLVVAGRVDAALRERVDGAVHLGMDAVAFLDGMLSDLGMLVDE